MSRIVQQASNAILDAAHAEREATRIFSPWLDATRTLRAYLILAAQRFQRAGSGAVIDFVLANQFRNAIVAHDGLALCLEAGAADAGIVHARSLFEVRLAIGWILAPTTEEDRVGRANAFHIGSVREVRHWTNQQIPGTPEYVEYRAACDPRMPPPTADAIAKATAHLADIARVLAHPKNAAINAEFDRLTNTRTGRVPEWYQVGPGGCRTLSDMASRLGLKDRYMSAYRYASHFAHGSYLYQGVSIRAKTAMFEPVRLVERLWTPFAIGMLAADEVLELLTTHYRPREVENLRRARPRWWKALANPPNIQVHETLVPLRGGPID
jgi:hypothetical protein